MVDFSDFVDLSPVQLDPSNTESSCLRAVAVINGKPYSIISANVQLNAHGFTNSAEIVLPINGNPDFSIELGDAAVPSSENDSPSVYVELWTAISDTPQYGDLSLDGLYRLFLGVIEGYEAPFQSNEVTFQCRSIAADLADTKITRITLNEAASTTFLAERARAAGLNFVSPMPGLSSPVTIQQILGKEFVGGASFTSTIYRKSAADLLIQASTFDDCDVWLEDDTIYYQTARSVQRGTPIKLIHGRDFTMREGVTASHALRQSKNVRVDVHSFQPRTRIATRTRLQIDPLTGAVTKTTSSVTVSKSIPLYGTASTLSQISTSTGTSFGIATSSGGTSTASSGLAADQTSVEKYAFYVPNQDPATCNKLATAIARQIASLEYRLTFTVPMTRALQSSLRIVSAFDVSGFPYDRFNDTYYARRLTHSLSMESGHIVTAEVVNHQMLQGELS